MKLGAVGLCGMVLFLGGLLRAADGGIYGDWITDDYGFPAFRYTFDELSDPRSPWPNSENVPPVNRERRDHFHVFGNQRVNVMAVDHGYVSLYTNDRGPTWLNRADEAQRNLGGGFSYVKTPGGVFSTAFAYAPSGSVLQRIWGLGYWQSASEAFGVRVRHRVFAPEGDEPFVIDEVRIENTSGAPLSLVHYEYWDVNRHQLRTQWVRTGVAAGPGDQARDALNGNFLQKVTRSGDVLTASMRPKPDKTPPPRSEPSEEDWYPPDIFLALLEGQVDEAYTDQAAFFGAGSPIIPSTVLTGRAPGELLAETDAGGQPAALIFRSSLSLSPGEVKTLRFAYGYLPPGKDLAMLDAYRAPATDYLAQSLQRWNEHLPHVDVPGKPLFTREFLWRGYLATALTAYLEYYGQHVITQGSAYLYLHGADGVPRDQSLFSMACVYLDAALTKQTLRLLCMLQHADSGWLPYSFTSHGVHDDALGIHRYPSDLDIFFFAAFLEYFSATGDMDFLDEELDFYPRGDPNLPPGASDRSVLSHLRAAFRHLKDTIGKGPNGLIRVWDGDWSDGITYEDLSPLAIQNTIANGESIPNTQMAAYILPQAARLLEARDAALASEMTSFAESLRAPIRTTFGSRWFGRAWLRNTFDQAYLKGNDQESDPAFNSNFIDLEAQPWGLLDEVLTSEQRERLLDEVEARLDEDSPIGPRLRAGTQVWPAISQLMTWAYARFRPASAWRSLEEHLYATHAREFPNAWLGIWAGPDGFVSTTGGADAGGTWVSPVTPMTDFPVANTNPEAMLVLGLIRTAGIEPAPGGLAIHPRGGGVDRFTVDLPLLRLEVEPGRRAGVYRAANAGSLTLRVDVEGSHAAEVWVRGQPIATTLEQGTALVPLQFAQGEQVPFEVRFIASLPALDERLGLALLALIVGMSLLRARRLRASRP